MQFPQWSNYSGANTLRFDIGTFTFWYSYKTLVAFCVPGYSCIVCENIWTKTTGKHLNVIDGGNKKNRVDAKTFERLVKNLIENNSCTKTINF
jgi:hypothetical protein